MKWYFLYKQSVAACIQWRNLTNINLPFPFLQCPAPDSVHIVSAIHGGNDMYTGKTFLPIVGNRDDIKFILWRYKLLVTGVHSA